MKTSTFACMLVSLIVAVTTAASPRDKTPPAATEPAYVLVSDLKPEHNGKEVTMAFEIDETYLISGSVPVGQFPSFGIRPVLKDGAPRFSVLVSGDLADLMNRFGMLSPDPDAAKGRVIQATGKITVFPAPKNSPNRGPSYQLNIREWKKFKIVPSPNPRRA
jgi:hypothetical protein